MHVTKQRIHVDKCVSIKLQIYLMISDTTLKACNKRKQFYIANINYYLWHCFDGNLKMICYTLSPFFQECTKLLRDDTWIIGLFALFFCVKRQRNKVISRQFFNQTYGTLWYNQKYNKYKCNANMSSICLVFTCTKMHNSKIWLLVFCKKLNKTVMTVLVR